MKKLFRRTASAAMSAFMALTVLNSYSASAEVTSNPVISRNCPAYSGSGNASSANDDYYFSFWNSSTPDYLAYDLSSATKAQRKQVIAVWYTTCSYDNVGGYANCNMIPSDYTIEVNPAPGGNYPDSGWKVIETVSGNTLGSRQHVVDMNNYNWIRINISKADGEVNKSASINFDVHTVSDGVSDSWLFLGDSITYGGMNNCYGTGFATYVNQLDNRFFPIQENGGIGGITSTDGKNNIDRWLNTSPAKYVSIAYGTNDAWGNQTGTEKYYENTKYMIDAVLKAGKVPVLPRIPASTNADVKDNVPSYNAMIDKIYKEYGDKIIQGPDFEAFFTEHPEYLSSDGVHPENTGYDEMRKLWAKTMYEKVYSAESGGSTSSGSGLDYSKATSTLCDAKATDETKALMKYLKSVYGEHILSGQQEIYGGGNDGDYELEFKYIQNISGGKLPAIRGFDFMNYNPLYGWDDGTTERMIDWVNNQNGIATACWHINVPKKFSEYTLGEKLDWKECTFNNETDFDTAKAVIDGTAENAYVKEAIKNMAEQLQKLQEANVPVILRPFHEAEGNGGVNGEGSWFWWSRAGAETYKELWKILYTELTETYGLHNIIWEYNSYAYTTSDAWYPGDEYVDIVGFDKYNTVYNRHDGKTTGHNLDAESSIFRKLFELTDGEKMVSMPENDSVPSVENMLAEDAAWLYFCPWYGENLMGTDKNDPEILGEVYKSDFCITLDELPVNLYDLSSYANVKGDINGDGKFNVADLVLFQRWLLAEDVSLSDWKNADFCSDGRLDVFDMCLMRKAIISK